MNLSNEQVAHINSLYEKACAKMDGLVLLEGYRPRGIGFFAKRRANKAIALFNEILTMVPSHFQSLFFIAKLYQRLRNYEQSLFYFETALQTEHTNPNLPQEASIVAMHLGQLEKALAYSAEAVRRKPDHIGILGNHAMNLLVAARDEEAHALIKKALAIDPRDEINLSIRRRIVSVMANGSPRPKFNELV
jgi:tetratricopeptide (TPR) repeat protein